jgi:uncharacterized membrane protein YfcA
MSRRRPNYTWRYGAAFLAAAVICYWIRFEGWFRQMFPGHAFMAYFFSLGLAVVGIFLIAQKDVRPPRRSHHHRQPSRNRGVRPRR